MFPCILVSLILFCLSKQESFFQVIIDSALNEIYHAPKDSDYSYEYIIKETFGTLQFSIEPSPCGREWPEYENYKSGFDQLKENKYILFGTSSVQRPPKQYNCTLVTNNIYTDCIGFEAFLAQIICDRIALHYNIDHIDARFYLTRWIDLRDELYQEKFDVILSGMNVHGIWTIDGKDFPREQQFVFTCPYQETEDALVLGSKQLPIQPQSLPIRDISILNDPRVIISAEINTTMSEWIKLNLPLATFRSCGGSISSTMCREWTLDREVHIYVAPLLNAAYDSELHEDLNILYFFKEDNEPIAMAARIVADSTNIMSICSFILLTILLV